MWPPTPSSCRDKSSISDFISEKDLVWNQSSQSRVFPCFQGVPLGSTVLMLQFSICHTCSVVPALFICTCFLLHLCLCNPCFGVNALDFIPRRVNTLDLSSPWGQNLVPKVSRAVAGELHCLGRVSFTMNSSWCSGFWVFPAGFPLALLCWSACSCSNCPSSLLKNIQNDAGNRSLS